MLPIIYDYVNLHLTWARLSRLSEHGHLLCRLSLSRQAEPSAVHLSGPGRAKPQVFFVQQVESAVVQLSEPLRVKPPAFFVQQA